MTRLDTWYFTREAINATRVKAKDRTFKAKAEAKDLTQSPSSDVLARVKENMTMLKEIDSVRRDLTVLVKDASYYLSVDNCTEVTT